MTNKSRTISSDIFFWGGEGGFEIFLSRLTVREGGGVLRDSGQVKIKNKHKKKLIGLELFERPLIS